jgi:hypothetical protein
MGLADIDKDLGEEQPKGLAAIDRDLGQSEGWWAQNIGNPTAKVIQKGGEALDWADRGFGMFKRPEGAPSMEQAARDVNPLQTPISTGITIGTMGMAPFA